MDLGQEEKEEEDLGIAMQRSRYDQGGVDTSTGGGSSSSAAATVDPNTELQNVFEQQVPTDGGQEPN